MFELGNRMWHTDSSFKRLPARASLLYARTIPPVGGQTEFADKRAAYDALPDEMKQRLRRAGGGTRDLLFAREARLFQFHGRGTKAAAGAAGAGATMPGSGRKAFYLASHAGRVFGMPEAEGRALIDNSSSTQRSASSCIRTAGASTTS